MLIKRCIGLYTAAVRIPLSFVFDDFISQLQVRQETHHTTCSKRSMHSFLKFSLIWVVHSSNITHPWIGPHSCLSAVVWISSSKFWLHCPPFKDLDLQRHGGTNDYWIVKSSLHARSGACLGICALFLVINVIGTLRSIKIYFPVKPKYIIHY